MIRTLIWLLLGVLSVRGQPFCSAYCTNYFSGTGYTQDCTGSTNLTCTGCDSRFFFLSGTSCNISSSQYNLEAVDLAPSGVLDGTWSLLNSSNIVVSTYNTSYTILEFTQKAAMTKSFTIANPHSAIRFRMFIMLVGNPQFTMQLILDGQTTSPITVDQSPRLYLSSTTSDAYVYTTDEIPHSAGGVTLTISVSSFTSGSFGIKELLVLSKACPANCSGCDSTGACTGCLLVDGGLTQYFLSQGQCLLYCQSGWYMDSTALATVPDKCIACNPICLTCDVVSTNCTSCNATNPNFKFYFNNSCVSTCPSGNYYVPTNWVCLPCFKGCSSCYAGGKDSCDSCGIDSQGIYYTLVAGTTSCELYCPPGQFNDTSLFYSCSRCDLKCATCSSNSTYCMSCTTNSTNEAFFFEHNNSCLAACPTNYTNDRTTHTCICPTNFYVEIGTQKCLPCSNSCATCVGPSLDNCTSCNFYYYLLVNSTRCRTSCPTGQYSDDMVRKCRQCDAICYACTGSASYCTGCGNGTYLNGSVCLPDCPNGYEKSVNPNKCKLCPQMTYSYNGSCMTVCPPGYGPVGVVCLSNEIRNRKKASFSVDLSIVNTGSRLQAQFKFSAPLSPNSNLSYANIQVFLSNSLTTARLLESVERLDLKNLFLSSDNTTLTLMTSIPNSIDSYQQSSLVVSFNQQYFFSSDGLLFDTYSATLPLNDPLFVNQLFSNYYKSSLDGVGIFLTVGAIIIVVAAYWNHKCGYLSLEFLTMVQTVRLFNFFKYPLDLSLAAYLRGFDASHFQFIPNALSLALTTYRENAFDGYKYKSTDMNFLRLSGSMLQSILLLGLVIGYLHLYDKLAFKKVIKWITKCLVYFCCTNLFFATTSSFVGLWLNTGNTQPVFIVSQLIGLLAGALIILYFYRSKKRVRKEGLFVVSSGINCVLYPLFGLSKPIVLILVVLFQSLLIAYFYSRIFKKQARYWCILLMRCSVLLMLNLVVMVESSTVLIYVLSTILFIDLVAVLYVYYLTLRKKLKGKQQGAGSENTLDDNRQRIPMSNNTLITEMDEKIKGSISIPNETIIYEHDIQESPSRNKDPPAIKEPNSRLEPAQASEAGDLDPRAATQRPSLDSMTLFGGGKTVYPPSSKRRVKFNRDVLQNKAADEEDL